MKRQLLVVGWVLLILAVLCMRPWKGVEDAGAGERQVFYALDQGDAVRFRVGAGESRMRVLARLETPAPDTLDESRTWRFGVGLSLEGGGVEHKRVHWTRSRLTLLEDGTPAAVTPVPERVVTDTRILDLELAPHMAEGGVLTLRAADLEPGQRLLLRSFRETPRSRAELAGGAPASVQERLRRTYPLPWPELTAQERRWYVATKRLTLPAEELLGAETVALTRYAEPSMSPTAETWGYRLNPGESTAVNVRGPAVLRVWAAGERDKHSPSASDLPISLVDATEGGPVEGGVLGSHRVEVPEGALWSLQWHRGWNQPPVYLSYEIEPDQGQSWGEPPGAGAAQPLAPERRRLTLWRVGPESEDIVVPAAAAGPWGVLRVEARPLADAAWKAQPAEGRLGRAVTLHWEAVDAQGKVLAQGSWEAPFEHAPFERYVEAEDEPVSEPHSRYLHHPKDAVALRFSADAPVDLRFHVPLDVQPKRAPEYALESAWRGRYAPWELAPYLSLAPLNAETLAAQDRLYRLDATVRIEPRADQSEASRSVSDLRTFSVVPQGRPVAHPILQPVRRAGPFKPHHRTRMGRVTRLQIPESGVVQVDVRVADPDIGRELSLQCGDSPAQSLRLYSGGGVLTFSGLSPGEQDCSLSGPEGFFLADVPGQGARWARRDVYRADAGTLRILAQVRDPVEVLYARAYTGPGRPAPVLHVRVDGGEPEHQSGVTERRTPGARDYVPPESRGSARLVHGGNLEAWSGMPVVLGDDLSRGVHVVEFSATAPDGGPVYLRFDGSWQSGSAEIDTHWVVDSPEDP